MGQALYRKYRSKSLAEIVGQEHITDTLSSALKSGAISHAYLFTGPRGVGKTSIARILAHEINNLPYDESEAAHLDIIEIDAASNRRIDEIRDLRDKVFIAPTSAKYKVYIIDEVHMLTREAFNALLKTLEEPPAHAVFILATTELHKLPETIVSRTQRFTFKPIEAAKVVKHLATIAKAEHIIVDEDALRLIAAHGGGSFRDSISLLDQARSHAKSITVPVIESLIGLPPTQAIAELLVAVIGHAGPAQLYQQLHGLYDQGFAATTIAAQLSRRIRSDLQAGESTLPLPQAVELLGGLVEVPASHDPEVQLEISLVTAAAGSTQTPVPLTQPSAATAPTAKEVPPASTKPTPAAKRKPVASNSAVAASAKTDQQPPEAPTPTASFDEAIWPEVLASLKQKYNTLYGVIRMAQPSFGPGNSVQLAFAFAFHQKRVNEAKNRQLIAEAFKQLTGEDVEIRCVHDKTAKPAPTNLTVAAPATPAPELTTISNIFGGGELLES